MFINLLAVQAQTIKSPLPLPSKGETNDDPCNALSTSGLGVFGTRGIVMEVTNGDTIKILSGKKITVVRLAGIESPKKKQEFGRESQQHLETLVLDKEVEVSLVNTNQSKGKEIAGIVRIDDDHQTLINRKQNINLEQIKAGMARSKDTGSDDPLLKQELCYYRRAESEAQSNRRGLWQNANRK